MLAAVNFASSEIIVNEVMPHINNSLGNEWIELYNNGTLEAILDNWTVDDDNFDSITILPGQYIIIARELTDGTDADNDSFESIWGNNDRVWNLTDGNYSAVDGVLSLTNGNYTIALKNGSGSLMNSAIIIPH